MSRGYDSQPSANFNGKPMIGVTMTRVALNTLAFIVEKFIVEKAPRLSLTDVFYANTMNPLAPLLIKPPYEFHPKKT